MTPVSVLLSAALAQPPPVVSGRPTTDHPDVVALVLTGSAGTAVFCTGTLVAPDTLLTAAHCITETEGYLASGFEAQAWSGANLRSSGPDAVAGWVSWSVHPAYSDASDYDHDIAIVVLDGAIGEGVSLREASLAGAEGAAVTFVGFGWTGDGRGDAGVKRDTVLFIDTVLDHTAKAYAEGTNLCNADSGGAGFDADGALALVPVYVQPRDAGTLCEGGLTGSVRVDAHLDWIRDAAGLSTEEPEPADTGSPADSGGGLDSGVVEDDDADVEEGQSGSAKGGCATGGGVAAGAWLAVGALLTRRRRRFR